jgi:hypothetical protein
MGLPYVRIEVSDMVARLVSMGVLTYKTSNIRRGIWRKCGTGVEDGVQLLAKLLSAAYQVDKARGIVLNSKRSLPGI